MNRCYVVVKWKGGLVFYNPIIRSQSFGEPMLPDYESHKYFSEFFPPFLMWDRMAREGWSSVCPFSQMEGHGCLELHIFLPPGQLGSDKKKKNLSRLGSS